MASNGTQSAPSRARTQARKKVNDDAAYFGPSSSSGAAGTKRQAADRADGEPRVKRKRVDAAHVVPNSNNVKKDAGEGEPRKCLVRSHTPDPLCNPRLTHLLSARVPEVAHTRPPQIPRLVRHRSSSSSVPPHCRGSPSAIFPFRPSISGSPTQSSSEHPTEPTAARKQGSFWTTKELEAR